jgi:omega-amidase
VRGAELMVVIANWPSKRAGHWTTLLQARAIENQAYVVGVNRVGTDPNAGYVGGSTMIDPRGEILAAADDHETVLRAAFDRSHVHTCREKFPALRDMRPKFLGENRETAASRR